LKKLLIGFPEHSVPNYQSTLCNIPEEEISLLRRDGRLKSRLINLSMLYQKMDYLHRPVIRVKLAVAQLFKTLPHPV